MLYAIPQKIRWFTNLRKQKIQPEIIKSIAAIARVGYQVINNCCKLTLVTFLPKSPNFSKANIKF